MNVQARIPHHDDADVRAQNLISGRPPEPKQLSLIGMLQTLRMRPQVFAGAAGGLFAIIALVTLLTPPEYRGSAIVMMDVRQNNTINVQQVLTGLPTDQSAILDQVQILQSRELASRVVDKLNLDSDPEFSSSSDPSLRGVIAALNPIRLVRPSVSDMLSPDQLKELAHQRVLDSFESRLSVVQLQLSTAIRIDFLSHDPGKASRIANAIADAYVEDQLNAKFEATQRATHWISSRLGKLAQDARVAEAALERYKADNHLTDVASSTGTGTISVLDQQIAAATTQLMQAQMDRAQAEATYARVHSLANSGHAADVSSVVNSPLIGQLRQQEAELTQKQAELASRYGPDHPKMLDLMAQKRDLQAKIGEEIQHVVGTAENDVAVAAARENALSSALHGLESQSTVQGSARVKERELEANATSSRALYDAFVDRMKQTEQEQSLQLPDARIISRSDIPTAASYPPVLMIMGAAVPISLAFGFMIVVLLERLDNGFRTVSNVEEMLELPVLSTLPDAAPQRMFGRNSGSDDPQKVAEQVVDRPLSSFAEAVRGLYMGLTLSNVDESPRVVLVTSAVPGEGKTTTALSLARHVALSGKKVILIDGDLRRPSISGAAGVQAKDRDLIDVLSGTCSVDDAISTETKSGLVILPAARFVKNAPDLLGSLAMHRLLSNLRSRFEFVVIDSAPILPVNDTKVLLRLVDAILFVVRWERTPRNAAMDAVRTLREARAPLAGIVLSRADTKRFHYYSFGDTGYYATYAKYYEA
jgi:succinoglycan biosynthesis transport protein ExoP